MMTRIYALLAIALLVTQVLSAPVAKQEVGERKATNKEAANLEEELHKQAGEGKKDTPETNEPSPGHKPRGALGQLMEAAAEAKESEEEKEAATKTEDSAKLKNVIYSIYNNPEVLKALLRAGETQDTNQEVLPLSENGLKRNYDDDDDDDQQLRSNIIKKDGDDLYEPMMASKKMSEDFMSLNEPNMPILNNKYYDVYNGNDLYGDPRDDVEGYGNGDPRDDVEGYGNEPDEYPGGPLTAEEEEALAEMENMNEVEPEDEDLKEAYDTPPEEDGDNDDEEEPDEESTTKPPTAQ